MTTITRGLGKAVALALLAAPAAAQELRLPAGAERSVQQVADPGRYAVPTGVWTLDAGLPTQIVEGRVVREAWTFSGSGLTPTQIIAPLRDQLAEAGYDIALDCAARDCGGFDFRFGTEVLPAPQMYVDLTAFRFVSAIKEDGAVVTLLASRGRQSGFLQIVRAGHNADEALQIDTGGAPLVARNPVATTTTATPTQTGLIATLEAQGHAVLLDLVFGSGSADLGDGPITSLDMLADYLTANPTREIVFVGHTDATGSLAANQALSKRRAQSAVDYLRAAGVPAGQISADGVGYLSPLSSNLTEAGRDANRRVEAVLISTE